MRELLLPQTTILTPNSIEARRLAEADDDDEPTLAACAERLLAMGCEYVLITGTHEPTPQVVNTLYGAGGVVRSDTWQRLPGSYHGSGCTLASAIAAMLANGLEMPEAVREAQDYTWQTLKTGLSAGHGPVPSGSPVLGARGARRARRRRAHDGPRARCPRQPLTTRSRAGARGRAACAACTR